MKKQVEWTKEQVEDILDKVADMRDSLDDIRQVMILTVGSDGSLDAFEMRRDDSSMMEALGCYEMASDSLRASMSKMWSGHDIPRREGERE